METPEIASKGIDVMTYVKIITIAGSIVWGYATLSAQFSSMKDEIAKIAITQTQQGNLQYQMNDRLLRIEVSNENERERKKR